MQSERGKLKSFRNRLLLTLLPILCALIAVSGSLLVHRLSSLESKQMIDQSREILYAKTQIISKWLETTSEEIKNLQFLLPEKPDGFSFDHPYISALLNQQPQKYESLFFTDTLGRTTDSFGQVSQDQEADFFKTLMKATESAYFSTPTLSERSGKRVFTVRIAVYDESSQITGIFGGRVYSDFLSQIVGTLQIRKNGYGWIMDKMGRLVGFPVSNYLVSDNIFGASEDEQIKQDTLLLDSILKTVETAQGGISEIVFETGKQNVVIFESISGSPGWVLGVTIDKELFFEETLLIVNTIILLFTSIGFLLVLILVFTSQRLIQPLKQLESDIHLFGKGNLSVRTQATGYREIAKIGEVFNDMSESLQRDFLASEEMNQKLLEANEQLGDANTRLEESNQHVNVLAKGMNRIIGLTSSLSEAVIRKDESFLHDLLEMLMELVPVANYGSISVIEKDRWQFVHAIGHDLDTLKKLDLKANYLFWTKDPIVVNYLMNDENNPNIPSATLEKLRKATRDIRSSVVCRLSLGEEKLGSIALDLATQNPVDFSQTDINIARAFSNVASAFLALQKYMISQGKFQKDLLFSMIKILEIFDPYTKGHSESVAKYSAKIAEALGLPSEKIARVYWAGLVHDIGKILVPTSILRKQTSLTDEEFDIIKKHPVWGAEVLKSSEELEDIVESVMYHHERWNGNGYPSGLTRKKIPLFSRIIAVADAYDAMTSDRHYRKPLSQYAALLEIEGNLDTQFDPEIGEAFIRMVREENLRQIKTS